jgi:hypothetical protein
MESALQKRKPPRVALQPGNPPKGNPFQSFHRPRARIKAAGQNDLRAVEVSHNFI